MREKFDVIVIGGGAAGLMCAIEAGKRKQAVLVIEHAEKIGKKILISGGGRCNFTNLTAGPENYISSNPHFHKSALARYTPSDFISLVEKHHIKYHEKKLGQLFCDGSSKQIVEMLETGCRANNVKILINCTVNEILRNDAFLINTSSGSFASESVVIATGGASIPKMGATDFGYRIAKQFGLKIIEYKPALVPLTFDEKFLKLFGELSGISLDTTVSCNGISFRENILFTHKGLSGPAILQASNYWNKGDVLKINLLPEIDIEKIILENRESNILLSNFLGTYLPKRFLEKWCSDPVYNKPVSKLTEKNIIKIKNELESWKVIPAGTEGFAKAEVTKGGINTDELSSKTMESKKIKGLYFIGEVVDVTGWLGGYNFQWAWASGFAAGQYA